MALLRYSVVFGAKMAATTQNPAQIDVSVRVRGAEQTSVSLKYLLGCDGAKSFVRSQIGATFPWVNIDRPQLVLDLAEFSDQVLHYRFFCNPARPLNRVPVAYGGRRLEFMLLPNDDKN